MEELKEVFKMKNKILLMLFVIVNMIPSVNAQVTQGVPIIIVTFFIIALSCVTFIFILRMLGLKK